MSDSPPVSQAGQGSAAGEGGFKISRRAVLGAGVAGAAGAVASGLGATPAAAAPSAPAARSGASVASMSGLSASVTPDGQYEVHAGAQQFAGSVDAATGITTGLGLDQVGHYQSVTFGHLGGTRQSEIRLYDHAQAVLLRTTYRTTVTNQEADRFPRFTTYPQLAYRESYMGCSTAQQTAWTGVGTPWISYDDGFRTVIISPASQFTATGLNEGEGSSVSNGLRTNTNRIDTVPAGLTIDTVLVVGDGLNATYDLWGGALTALGGKRLPGNDQTTVLNTLGYWTDNGAAYYYNPGPGLPGDPNANLEDAGGAYIPTLLAVLDSWRSKSIPVRYLQIDGWWYPKGPDQQWYLPLPQRAPTGLYTLSPHPAIFPNGLPAFAEQAGLPLAMHSKWVAPESPYRRENGGPYEFSDAVSIDPKYWSDRMTELAAAGVTMFEHDWLCNRSVTVWDLTSRAEFLDGMADAAAAHGIDVQYCLPSPMDILHSSTLDAVTNSRVSGDHFTRGRWNEMLFNSRLARSVGLWPWADVCNSDEQHNLLLMLLTAGPVGVGDLIGNEQAGILLRTARQDGVLVKPDVPIAPTDESHRLRAREDNGPTVSVTHTDHSGYRTGYLYAFANTVVPAAPPTVVQAEDGVVTGPKFAKNHLDFTGTGFIAYQMIQGSWAEWTFDTAAGGPYSFMMRYASIDSGRTLNISLNGAPAGTIAFPATDSWDDWSWAWLDTDVPAGTVTIRATLDDPDGGPNVDAVGLRPGTLGAPDGNLPATFGPAAAGIQRDCFVYDWFAGTGQLVPADKTTTQLVGNAEGSLFALAPVSTTGIAFLGDSQRYVGTGKKRISALFEAGPSLHAQVEHAASEPVVLHGWARSAPTITAGGANISGMRFDAGTGHFRFTLTRQDSAAGTSQVTMRLS